MESQNNSQAEDNQKESSQKENIINVLLTKGESQILLSTVHSLKEMFSCKLVIIGSGEENLGKFLADKFVTISAERQASDKYLQDVLQICKEEHIQVIIPHTMRERLLFNEHNQLFNEIGVKVLSSNSESIKKAENKLEFLSFCKEIGIPLAEYYLVTTTEELEEKAKLLGYPQKKIVVKPAVSRGSRGFRILHKHIKFKHAFYETRGDGYETRLTNLKSILGKKFPPLIVSEYLPGKEYTIDCLRQGDQFLAIPRVREEVKMGLTFKGRTVKHEELINYSQKMAEELNLTSVFGFQFKEDEQGNPKVLECNPRIQGTMIMSTLAGANIIGLSVKHLLGEETQLPQVKWGTTYQRLWSGIVTEPDGKVNAININLNKK